MTYKALAEPNRVAAYAAREHQRRRTIPADGESRLSQRINLLDLT